MKIVSNAPMLDYTEAKEVLGFRTMGTLYSLVSRRQIPHIRLSPRMVRFSRQDLEEWLSERRVPVEDNRQRSPSRAGSVRLTRTSSTHKS